MMLLRFDPFRELDRLAQEAFRPFRALSTASVLPLDVYRDGDRYILEMDLPGVDPATIDVHVEDDVLTVSAERPGWTDERDGVIIAERPRGRFRRQLSLGKGLDVDGIEARYDGGVLRVTLPVAEHAKVRKVEITTGNGQAKAIEATAKAA